MTEPERAVVEAAREWVAAHDDQPGDNAYTLRKRLIVCDERLEVAVRALPAPEPREETGT